MEYKIALAGNPNCGKTTMFNDLTGSSQYVGNWRASPLRKRKESCAPTSRQSFRTYRASIPFPPTHWRRWSPEIIWSADILMR